ncbi:DDE_3 domain-containing protein [Trichonephila clavipes]|nr:DDE_3 domain-containing protein [Trichonephila clavipes]
MGRLICLDTTLTGNRGIRIRSDQLYLFMSIVHSKGLGEFHQDKATTHTSGISAYWLQEHSSEFRHFCWPPKSPDFIIIEYF